MVGPDGTRRGRADRMAVFRSENRVNRGQNHGGAKRALGSVVTGAEGLEIHVSGLHCQ
jgi:hypothetical protein